MSRNLKPHRSGKTASRKKSGGGTLVGLFIGLVLGVVCAAAVVWYIHKAPAPFTRNGHPAPAQPATPPGTAPVPMALPGKPGDAIPRHDDKPRFDFDKILPGSVDAIPDPRPADAAKANDPKPADTAKAKESKEGALKEPVYLQTGSFQNASDADHQKARLALMGIEASVQQVMLQDKVWYRVRLGPFRKIDEVNGMRSELAKQGVEANVVKKD